MRPGSINPDTNVVPIRHNSTTKHHNFTTICAHFCSLLMRFKLDDTGIKTQDIG